MPNMDVVQSAPRAASRVQRVTAPMFEGSTYRSWGYLLAGLPLGVLWFSLLVPLYITGAALVVIWIGLGGLALTQSLARGIGRLERWLARVALGADIADPHPLGGRTPMQRGQALIRDQYGYRVLLWSLVRLVTGTVGFVLAVVSFVVPISLTFAPVSFVWGVPPTWGWTLVMAPLLGIPAFFGAAHLIKAVGRANAWLAEAMLGSGGAASAREAARRAARAEEQVRIDQELHDSIGHVLTMNVVQAAAGAHVFDNDPEFAREALTNIERRGRDALAELDRIISMVRSEQVMRNPLPGLADLEGLMAEAREAGMEVRSDIHRPAGVPAEVGRAAYRIVREALTNAAKHAAGSVVRVTVTGDGTSLAVEIVNSPPPPSTATTPGSGSGLAGVHQRVSLLGGRSEAGPTAEGGFRVYASLPIRPDST